MCFARTLRRWAGLLAGLGISVLGSSVLACSTVVLGPPDRPVVAYSFDYAATGAGFVFVNPATASRRSIMDDMPAQWAVRFGSVTFNQMGPGMPAAGMNTAGLVVSLMWNDEAEYGGLAAAPVVNELEFIQRLLDTSGTVAEALEAVQDVRIQGIVPIHFLLADRTGATAIVTPTAGGPLIHTAGEMPVTALTNTSYAELLDQMTGFQGFGGDRAWPSSDGLGEANSLARFLTAAAASRDAGSAMTSADAFDVLDRVANTATRWQIVFEPAHQRIAFRTAGQDEIRLIDLREVDFRCRGRPLAAGLSDSVRRDVSMSLAPVDPKIVSDATREVLASLRQSTVSPAVADGLTAGLLASLACE